MSAYQEICQQQRKEIEKFAKMETFLQHIPLSTTLQNAVHVHLENASNFQQFLYRQEDIQEMYFLYETYLKEVASLFLKHHISHPFEVSQVCSEAIYQGIFSKEGDFEFEDSIKDNDIFLLLAHRIMSGTGVCRHISALFSDFSDNFPFSAPEVYGFSAYPWQTKRKAFKKNIGHAINIITWQGKSMGFDLTNQDEYFFTSKKRLETMNREIVYYIAFFTTLSMKEQNEILNGPYWSREEYIEEIKKISETYFPYALFDDLRALQEQSKSQLSRISEIEEKYQEPQKIKRY